FFTPFSPTSPSSVQYNKRYAAGRCPEKIMHLKLISLAVLAAVLLAMLAPPTGLGQWKGKGDPMAMFDRLAKDRGYFLISETDRMRQVLTDLAQVKGITDGKITRQLWLGFMEFNKGKKMGGPPATPQKPPTELWSQWAEAEFKQRDVNGDDKLSTDEM